MSDSDIINENISETLTQLDDQTECFFDELQELISKNILDLNKIERAVVIRALSITQGNKQEAAKLLGIGRTTLYDKLEKFELK